MFRPAAQSGNPSDWPGYDEDLERARKTTGASFSVTTGFATIGGERCVLIGSEFAFFGGSMGTAEGAMITHAFASAVDQRVPVVCVTASGGARMQEGTSALVQMQAAAAAIAAARKAGVPFAAVAGDPTTGGMWASLVAAADVVMAADGARISFSGTRTRPIGADPAAADFYAAGKWQHGHVDVLGSAAGIRRQLAVFLTLLSPRSRVGRSAVTLVGASQPARSGSAQVRAARRPGRAKADRWLAGFDKRFEIRGDRAGGADAGLRCGFGSRHGQTFGYIAQLGKPTTAAGFRTAIRLIGLAERFGCPILTLIDSPGAASAPDDEADGVGTAIAELLVAVASCTVPITSVIIGDGVSGGAIALCSPDDLWISPDGYLAVAAPELATAILKRDSADVAAIADLLRLTPADLTARGIVRGVRCRWADWA